MANSETSTITVWDLPTRLFHWGLAACVIGAYVTVKLGGLWMDWHVRFGLAAFGLILFRLIWGLVGPYYARFTQFFAGPAAVWKYLNGRQASVAGHNPLASWSVMAMLLVFGFQAFSGLFADDDIFTSGPLAYLSETWSARMTGLHKLNEWPMIVLVAAHILAISVYHFWLRRPLVRAMIKGDLMLPGRHAARTPSARDDWNIRLAAALLGMAIGLFIWWLTGLAPADTAFY